MSEQTPAAESAAEPPAEPGNLARIMVVLRNPRVRRLQLASMGSVLGDWAFTTAIVAWAYLDGGAAAVGAYQAVRYIAMAIAAPLGGAIADRMSRKAFMLVCDAARAGLIAIAAVLIGTDGPALVVFALAILAAIVGAPFRAAQAGWLPELVDSPEDLTAANAIAGNIEMAMSAAGPAIAGVLIAVTDVQVVFWLNAATFVWSFLLVLSIRADAVPATEDDSEEQVSYWTDLTAGFGLVARNRNLRDVGILAAGAGFAWGSLTVYMVLLVADVLESGPEGLGYLNAILGAATAVGGLVVLTRLSSNRLGRDMVLGALGWGLPILAIAAFPSPVTVFVAFVVFGLSEPLSSLGLETIPQRVAPPDFVSRVYSAIDSALIGPMALGALVAPGLVDLVGLRTSLAITGGVIIVVGLTRWPNMRELDREFRAPSELVLLRSVPIFASLPGPSQERLAHAAEHTRVPAGSTVLAEGGISDRFYVIVSGTVEVSQNGRLQRTEGPGEFFGEIGLLRDVLRTATVTATEDCELLVIERADFLAAVGSTGETRSALEDVVVGRLFA